MHATCAVWSPNKRNMTPMNVGEQTASSSLLWLTHSPTSHHEAGTWTRYLVLGDIRGQ